MAPTDRQSQSPTWRRRARALRAATIAWTGTSVSNRAGLVWTALAVAILGVVLLVTAWVCDDAYITFRTLDNAVRGHGLRWNIAERVQTYTHPLWLLLLLPIYALTGEIFYTVTVVSVVLSLVAFALLLRLADDSWGAFAVAAAAVLGSKCFVDWSTSGLETPLTMALLAALSVLTLRRSRPHAVALLFSCLLLTRLDSVLVAAPLAGISSYRNRHRLRLGRVLLALSPLVAWHGFSLFYYGSPWPNTAAAKLNRGLVPRQELLVSGARYIDNLLHEDPLTFLVVASAVVLPVLARRAEVRALAAGACAHVAYVWWIGGDFMGGRFFVPSFVASLAAWLGSGLLLRPRMSGSGLAITVVLGLLAPNPPAFSLGQPRREPDTRHGIADERDKFFPIGNVLRGPHPDEPGHSWAQGGRQLGRGSFATAFVVGHAGFYAGPRLHLLDVVALGDPLLAQLFPVTAVPGHFQRGVPPGYAATVVSGENQLVDPNLRRYGSLLLQATRGPLFDTRRLGAIYELRFGAGPDLIASYRLLSGRSFRGSLAVQNDGQCEHTRLRLASGDWFRAYPRRPEPRLSYRFDLDASGARALAMAADERSPRQVPWPRSGILRVVIHCRIGPQRLDDRLLSYRYRTEADQVTIVRDPAVGYVRNGRGQPAGFYGRLRQVVAEYDLQPTR